MRRRVVVVGFGFDVAVVCVVCLSCFGFGFVRLSGRSGLLYCGRSLRRVLGFRRLSGGSCRLRVSAQKMFCRRPRVCRCAYRGDQQGSRYGTDDQYDWSFHAPRNALPLGSRKTGFSDRRASELARARPKGCQLPRATASMSGWVIVRVRAARSIQRAPRAPSGASPHFVAGRPVRP